MKTAAEQAYNNYNPGYQTQKTALEKSIATVQTVMSKIDEAVAKCISAGGAAA